MSHVVRMSPQQYADHVARNRALRLARAHPERAAPKPEPSLREAPTTFGGAMIEFCVPGTPIPKGRPRLGRGHTYTPKRTVEAENVVRSVAQLAQVIPLVGALIVHLDFFMPIPKAWNRAKTQSAMLGTIRPTNRGGDIDNLCKLLLDACQGDGGCFHDDAQIVELVCRKWYGEPRTVVKIVPVP